MDKIKKLKSVHECLLKQNETSNTNSYHQVYAIFCLFFIRVLQISEFILKN